MRPAERHCRTRRFTAFHASLRQIGVIPNLLRQHAAFIGKAFERADKSHRISAGSQLVMAALAGQQWPATASAGSIIGAAVVLLAVTIVIVAPPAWTLRQVPLQDLIDHCHGIFN